MKITVIGGTGLIGKKVVSLLEASGHEVIAASRSSGVDTLTGDGLATALSGAAVVVDVSNSPSLEDSAASEFFRVSTRNVLAAAEATGVSHYVALSIVGTDGLQSSGYFRGKLAQEQTIAGGHVPFTIVRATQFFEFAVGIAQFATAGGVVRLGPVLVQPVAANDVAAEIARVAMDRPFNAIVDFAGPERMPIADWVRRTLRAGGDEAEIIIDPAAGYFGLPAKETSLVPAGPARLGPTRLTDWLATSSIAAAGRVDSAASR